MFNYLVDMHDTRKRKRVLHVNMLKRWQQPLTNAYWSGDALSEQEEEEEEADWNAVNDTIGSEKISGQLSDKEHEELKQMLQNYSDVLQDYPGRRQIAEHHITTGTAQPIKLPPYRLPHAYRERVQQELDQMLKDGIISSSESDWAALIVLVPKKDGSIRLCVDYRRLNEVSQIDVYPMPRIDNLIDRLGQACFISTLDLTRGYWQVPVAQKDQHKTAFATPFGFYQFKVMPFGLVGAPATFQRMMDKLLRGGEEFSAAYLDDLVIFSRTWEEHLEHVRFVLSQLREAGLTAKPRKCQFAMSHCTYLRHIVGDGQVLMDMY